MLFSAPKSQKPKAKPSEDSKHRSRTGIEIHSYIMQIILCTDNAWLERLFTNFLSILKDCTLSDFFEESRNGCTAFYDILIMPFKLLDNKSCAEEISNRLWTFAFDTLQRRFPLFVKEMLMKETKEGFMLLHAATFSCDSHVDKIVSLLKTKGFEEALEKNLRKCTRHGFRALPQAILSKSPYRVKKVAMLLQEEGNEVALRDNLNNVNTHDYMVLAQAAYTKSTEIYHIILAMLKTKGYENSLQRNLLSRSSDGFMLLQNAILSENEIIVKSTIELLNEKGNEEALMSNIKNFTNNGVGVLTHAFSTGNPIIIEDVLSLLQTEDAKEALMNNVNKLSLTFSHGAILDKNKATIQRAITVLKTEREIAKKHLTAPNAKGENCLSLAILSYDFEIVKMVDELLRFAFKEEVDSKIIELLKESNVISRFDRDKANYQLRAYVQSFQDKISQKEFERKGASLASNSRMRP